MPETVTQTPRMISAAPLDQAKVLESMKVLATALGGVASAMSAANPTVENVEAASRLRGAMEGACRNAARKVSPPAPGSSVERDADLS